MTDQEVRMHHVSVHGDVDRSAVLAAIERAVAAVKLDGSTSPQDVQRAISVSVSGSRQP